MSGDEDGVDFHLSADEAIVLYELLSRWSDPRERGPTPDAACFEAPAECAVLRTVLAVLGTTLVAPLRQDYGESEAPPSTGEASPSRCVAREIDPRVRRRPRSR